MADPIWWIQDGGYFNVKDVIVTSSMLLMTTTNLLSGKINLLNMLLLRVCGYQSNRYKNID